jgi:hypothetical protein
MPKEVGARVFDVMHDILVKSARPTPDGRSSDIGNTHIKSV